MVDEQFIESNQGDLLYGKPGKEAPDFVNEAKEFELEQKLMDEINLLYVAMTRPVQRLYLHAAKGAGTYNSLNNLFTASLDDLIDANLKCTKTEEHKSYKFGEPELNKETNTVLENTFEPKSIQDLLWFPEISLRDKEALESEDLSKEQRFGNQLHLILAETEQFSDLKKVLKQLKQKDTLEKDMLVELEKEATKVLQNSAYQTLLKDAKTVLNEQDIIIDKTTVKRPDKLLIKGDDITLLDFKTGEAKEKDLSQLRDYAFSLKEIGFKNVNGILFYTKYNRLERVF
jgi:ATP-dependent exoDNAse (exonuclease V) beta subunit